MPFAIGTLAKGACMLGSMTTRVTCRPMATITPPHASANGAFIDTSVCIKGSGSGPLTGLTFGAKDLFDLLLDAGADLVGKTAMDELAYSLNGENAHYGTPVNPRCPERVPGGSSSGSAVAVADGDVDIGLGSDTAGSVRVPASYCGLYGMRPTWGRVPLQGAQPLAPSYCTGAWFARTASVLARVGSVLLSPTSNPVGPLTRWLVAADAFDLAQPATATAIYDVLSADFKGVQRVFGGAPTDVVVGSVEGGLRQWMDVFRITQGAEVWEVHGAWVTQHQPKFGPGIKERFAMASQLTAEEVEGALQARARIREHVWALLGADGFLAVPTTPGPAPLLNTPPDELNAFRTQLISVSCIASLCQLPQVNIPLATVDGCPVGLGIIGPRNSDEALLELTQRLAEHLGLPA